MYIKTHLRAGADASPIIGTGHYTGPVPTTPVVVPLPKPTSRCTGI